jgi:hypothetical protein
MFVTILVETLDIYGFFLYTHYWRVMQYALF